MSLVRPDASNSMGGSLVGVAGGGRPSPLLLAALLALVVAPCAGLWQQYLCGTYHQDLGR